MKVLRTKAKRALGIAPKEFAYSHNKKQTPGFFLGEMLNLG